MNDSAVAAGGKPSVAKISEAVIRIAGNSQDGIQAIGGFLARLAGRSEQEVMTFMTIPVHDLRRAFHFPGAHWLGRGAEFRR